jgi:lipoprotein NlpI
LTKRDLDRAIADFTLAIKLDPKATTTYTNRGIAYRYQGDLDGAIADFTLAIKLDSKLAKAYSNRCWAYFGKGNNDQAIADCSQAIELNPKDPNGYFNRGRANLLTGVTAKALVDLNQARELDPKSAYTALWLDIANRRSNLPSGLSETVKQIDMSKWPAPVIRLYLGQSTLEAVIAAADDPDATTKQGRLCEANFYGGELTLQRGATDEAMRLLQLAVTGCPKSFIEYDDAKAELKVLGASR